LADVFQILGGNNSSGTLRLTSQYIPNPSLVYFADGNPIHAAGGEKQGVDAIYSLFGWVEGRFEFSEEKVNVKRTVKSSRMQIVLDALRMLDDGLIEKIGPQSLDAKTPTGIGGQEGKESSLPVIKGPLLNYLYVIDEDNYKPGDIIVKEGGHGRWIWVILEGMVDVVKATPKGPLTITRLGAGCFIGTFTALLHTQYIRGATITAVGEVNLGVLDMELLAREFGNLSFHFKTLLISLDGRLRSVSDKAVEMFLKKPEALSLKDKKVIMKRGATTQELHKILEGEAFIIGEAQKGHAPLATLGKDDVFGYVPFMDISQEPRFAAVMASENLKTEPLDPQGLQKEYDKLSDTFKSIINNVGTFISMTTGFALSMKKGK